MKVALFVSRNKDNKEVQNFKPRSKSFVFNEEQNIENKFLAFVNEGVENELSRMYISVNKRNEEKIRKQLICELVTNENLSLTKIETKIASIAMQAENAEEKQWLFDFDEPKEEDAKIFTEDVKKYGNCNAWYKQTKNGFAVVSEHGFDTRELLEKYSHFDVTLKRDAMLFVKSCKK
jgi:hypothetical protein